MLLHDASERTYFQRIYEIHINRMSRHFIAIGSVNLDRLSIWNYLEFQLRENSFDVSDKRVYNSRRIHSNSLEFFFFSIGNCAIQYLNSR